jgi:hypothetical protein
VEQRVVIKFCVDIGKTPTETHKFIKQSVTHSNVSRSLVFKWHMRFSDGRGSLIDDKPVVIILSRNPIPLWLNFLRNCLDASVLFVIFSSDNIMGTHRAQLRISKFQIGCTRLASDKVYQLLAHGRWFSQGTPLLSPLKLVAKI